jgi:c-di-GMP-binding flagellar brake protein YcgR
MLQDKLIEAVERRRYFRIEDRVALTYRVLDEETLAAALSRLGAGYPDKLSLASGFATASSQMRHTLERFRKDMPDVASYLEALNEKLDLVVQLLATTENDLANEPTHEVNLSASGISFVADEPVAIDRHVEMKLLLFPSYTCLLCFGTVVHCDPAEKGRPTSLYNIGVDFTHIREEDRDLIVRHVLQRQSTMLREARLSLGADETA